MKRYSFSQLRPSAMILILAVCLCVIGTGYAAWSRYLSISASVTSGSLNIVFDQSRPYGVEIVNSNGTRAGGAAAGSEISCVLTGAGKQARLSFERTLLLEELADSGRLLMLQYPLMIDENSTVRSVLLYEADLGRPAQEQLEFRPTDVQFTVGGSEYAAPAGLVDFETPLYWDVYRQLAADGDQLVGTIFLKLSAESLQALRDPGQLHLDVSELPEELASYVIPIEDGTSGVLAAEIKVDYSFSVPLFIEQAHQ